jgi:hypothetical protein
MDEQDLYNDIELIKAELENKEISLEEATQKLEEVLSKIDNLIEEKMDNFQNDFDQLNLFDDE